MRNIQPLKARLTTENIRETYDDRGSERKAALGLLSPLKASERLCLSRASRIIVGDISGREEASHAQVELGIQLSRSIRGLQVP